MTKDHDDATLLRRYGNIIRRQKMKPSIEIKEKPVPSPKMRVEDELIRLQEKLWRIRGRRSRETGAVLLILSAGFLFLAYITRYIVFEVTSILALLLGVIFVFVSMETYVKMRVANRAVLSPLISLNSLLSHLEVHEKAAHIPPTSKQDSGKIFVPAYSRGSLVMKGDDIVFSDEGVLLPSVGNSLLRLYEEDLGDLRNVDWSYLMRWLPRVLVEDLQMAKDIEIIREGDEIHVKMTDLAFRYICQQMKSIEIICKTIGCPMSSSIAEAIAKNTTRLVYHLGCSYDPLARETSALFMLGPTLETLKQKEAKGCDKNKG